MVITTVIRTQTTISSLSLRKTITLASLAYPNNFSFISDVSGGQCRKFVKCWWLASPQVTYHRCPGNWSGIYSHLAAVARVDVVKCHTECQQVIRWQQSRASSLSTRFVPPPSTVLTLLHQAVVYSTAHWRHRVSSHHRRYFPKPVFPYKQPFDNLTSVKIPHNNTLPVTHCYCVVFLSSTSRLVASLSTRQLFPPYRCSFNHSSPKLSLYYRADLTDFVFFPNYPFQGLCGNLTETSISLQY